MLDKKTERKIITKLLNLYNERVHIKIVNDLASGCYKTTYKTFGKFTIVELEVDYRNYTHHFFGLSAKNPNDNSIPEKGAGSALQRAVTELIIGFSEFAEDDIENIGDQLLERIFSNIPHVKNLQLTSGDNDETKRCCLATKQV